ncbi:MAG: NRDE family protein [Bacteroidota bacterium]
MCTVTFLPLQDNNFILTSNRDEAVNRKKALKPTVEVYKGKNILYPKDGLAGGTWIGVRESVRAAVLLNGAFIKHNRELPYRHSRGVIVKEALVSDSVVQFLSGFKLDNIEPFTLIVVEWYPEWRLWELRWDGSTRHVHSLSKNPQIWSSSTLYTTPMVAKRERWFKAWLTENSNFTVPGIRKFHKEAGEGDPVSDLITKRGFLETISITTIEKKGGVTNLTYEDLLSSVRTEANFNLSMLTS